MSESKNETLLFFPTVIRQSEIEDHEALTAQIMGEINNIKNNEPNTLPPAWSCDLYTTIGAPTMLIEHEEFFPLRDVIMKESDAFARSLELDIDKHPLKFTECWLNVYTEGHAQEVHHHSNAVISGIYYPKAPPGSGDLLIHSPFMDVMLEPPTRRTNGFNVKVMPITPQPGMMILFQSFVKHSVKPTKCKEERISIAFNLTM